MKKIVTLGLCLLLLSACSEPEPPPIKKLPAHTTEKIGIDAIEKEMEGFTVDAIQKVNLTPDKGNEILAIYHDEDTTYFKVYDEQKEGNEWKLVYEDIGLYNPAENYQIGLTYPAFSGDLNEHVLLFRQSGSGGYLSFFILGYRNDTIEKVLDNDFSEGAEPIYQGDFDFKDGQLELYSDGSSLANYSWISDGEFYYEED
jgi:hypothetical protein